MDWMDGWVYPGGGMYRASYGANKKTFEGHLHICVVVFVVTSCEAPVSQQLFTSKHATWFLSFYYIAVWSSSSLIFHPQSSFISCLQANKALDSYLTASTHLISSSFFIYKLFSSRETFDSIFLCHQTSIIATVFRGHSQAGNIMDCTAHCAHIP